MQGPAASSRDEVPVQGPPPTPRGQIPPGTPDLAPPPSTPKPNTAPFHPPCRPHLPRPCHIEFYTTEYRLSHPCPFQSPQSPSHLATQCPSSHHRRHQPPSIPPRRPAHSGPPSRPQSPDLQPTTDHSQPGPPQYHQPPPPQKLQAHSFAFHAFHGTLDHLAAKPASSTRSSMWRSIWERSRKLHVKNLPSTADGSSTTHP